MFRVASLFLPLGLLCSTPSMCSMCSMVDICASRGSDESSFTSSCTFDAVSYRLDIGHHPPVGSLRRDCD
jgi:hypothetical protein